MKIIISLMADLKAILYAQKHSTLAFSFIVFKAKIGLKSKVVKINLHRLIRGTNNLFFLTQLTHAVDDPACLSHAALSAFHVTDLADRNCIYGSTRISVLGRSPDRGIIALRHFLLHCSFSLQKETRSGLYIEKENN